MAPSVQRRKVCLTPTNRVPCSNAAKTRNPLKFAGVPQTPETISAVVGRSSLQYENMWMRYCCLTSFFRLSIHALVAKIQLDKFVRWCRDGDFLRHFCVLYFQPAACSTYQTWILNFSMVDIHSATAEITPGKKEEERRKIEETTGQKYNGPCPIS